MTGDHAARLDFVADITCPWCWIARRHMERAIRTLAAEGLSVEWVWRPYLIDPEMPAGGIAQPEHLGRRFGSLEAAKRYHRGVVEAGRAAGVRFRYGRITSAPNTINAHRLILWAEPSGNQPALAETLARAFFTEGNDIGGHAVLARLAGEVGLDSSAARRMLDGADHESEVRSADRAAKVAGIRGVPAFAMHGRILDVADPEQLAERLRVAHRSLASAAT